MYYSSDQHKELFLVKRTGASDVDTLIYILTSDYLRPYYHQVFDEVKEELKDFDTSKLSSSQRLMIALAKHFYNSINPCPELASLVFSADEVNREVISSAVYYFANAYKLKEEDLL